jgi:transglutaminase-like putative cysteine protease
MISRLIASCFVVLIATASTLARGDDWLPIDLTDSALKGPVVEKDADAEVIFWEVRLDDDPKVGRIFSQYVRIKVFTERGRDREARIDIPYAGNFRVENVAARTIKPDGSIVELKREDVFDRTIVKFNGAKVNAKSFALPAVEPGAIIEYRWREVRPTTRYVRLPFQRELPVRRVTYHFRSNPYISGTMHMAYFQMPPAKLVKEGNEFYSATMTNVAAFQEEPRMPPEDQVRSWMLVYYRDEEKVSRAEFWPYLGKKAYEIFKPGMKVNGEVSRVAAEANGNATSPEEKLQRLFHYCRDKIKNAYSASSGLSAADRANLKENKAPADTLKYGVGTGLDIDLLFAALAAAAGFDARVALAADREDTFFDPTFPDPYFLSLISIAVKVGNGWRFFDPGSAYVPFGMLRWQEEGQEVLVTDPANPVFVNIPLSLPEKSKQLRTANFRLNEDGTLEGDVRVEHTGHLGAGMKRRYDDDSPPQREKTLRDGLKAQMSTAELSDVHIDNATDLVKPFVYTYHIRVPSYAERTGKRIFLQPAFFQHGLNALFPTRNRKYDIYFGYPWSEQDEITIDLPDGYALDTLDELRPAAMGGGSAEYQAGVYIKKEGHAITYRRSFFFGRGGTILFSVDQYAELKDYFDLLHQLDNYTITLKQTASAGSTN